MLQRYGVLHIGFLGALGLTGWLAVVAVTLWPPVILRPWEASWELLAVFVLCGATRFLAFRVFLRVRVALDSVFYVASAFAFGVVPAAWIVLLVMTVHGLVRQSRATGAVTPGESPWHYRMAQVLNSGGSPALVWLAVGIALDIDGRFPRDDVTLAWLVPLFAILVLMLHYLLAGGSHWFDGARPEELWRRLFLRVVPAELTLAPIALAMVYGYLHQGVTPFLLLGAAVVLFNLIFRRGRIVRDKLDARIEELKTLARVGKILSSSLERRVLLANIANETLRLIGRGSCFTFGQLDDERKRVNYELFDEKGNPCHERDAPAVAGLSGWVMRHRELLLLGNVPEERERYLKEVEDDSNPTRRYVDTDEHAASNCNSWLGVPLVVYDEVVGIISVQTDQLRAYNEDTGRILSRIAEQAAVALENSRLYELATVDGLTRLLVRRHFDQRLEEEWERALRYGNPFALGILDLDNFKELNDNHGHQAGDWMLRAAATTVRKNMRAADLAGRYGGEEFAFLLPRVTVAEGCTVAERIRSDIENLTVEYGGATLTVRASIGVAGHPESGARDVDELIARADEALYQAKGAGKNCVVAAPTAPIARGDHERR